MDFRMHGATIKIVHTKLLGLQCDKHLSWKNNNDKLNLKLHEACYVDRSQPVISTPKTNYSAHLFYNNKICNNCGK
jgi:hypothetical protein